MCTSSNKLKTDVCMYKHRKMTNTDTSLCFLQKKTECLSVLVSHYVKVDKKALSVLHTVHLTVRHVIGIQSVGTFMHVACESHL